MTDSPKTIPAMESVFLAKVVERAESLGASRSEVLRGSMLREEVLIEDSAPIPSASVYLASSRAADLSGNSHICAELAEEYDWRTGFVMPPSFGDYPSLGDMLFAWLQFVETVQASMRYRLIVDGRHAQLSGRRIIRASQPPGQADAWDIATWVQMLQDLLGPTWQSASVEVAVFDPEAIPSRLVPANSVKKSDAWGLSITFPSAWLMIRNRQPDVGKHLDLDPAETAIDPSRLFETLDYASWPGTDGFAKFIGMHPKAFQRMLAAEGMSCSALVDVAKSRLAAKWIADPDIQFKSIALRLGYRNASAFTRSCHRWFDCAPEELRVRSASG